MSTKNVAENDINYSYFSNATLVQNHLNFNINNCLHQICPKYLLLEITLNMLHNVFKGYKNPLYRIFSLL